MRLREWTFAIVLTAIIAGCAAWSLNPLHKNEANLHIWLLQKTPLGSSVHDIEAVLAHEGWKAKYHWLWDPNDPRAAENARLAETSYPGVKGVEIIGADLGKYHAPWAVDIDVYWGFDSSGRLIDLHVRKMVDAL